MLVAQLVGSILGLGVADHHDRKRDAGGLASGGLANGAQSKPPACVVAGERGRTTTNLSQSFFADFWGSCNRWRLSANGRWCLRDSTKPRIPLI